jgi:hypothetical protein
MNSSVEAPAIPSCADVGIEPVEPKKPNSTVNQKAWYDIEYDCYVHEDCALSLPDNDGLALAVAQVNNPSLGLPQDPAVHMAMEMPITLHMSLGLMTCFNQGVRLASTTVRKACLNLRRICCRLLKSKRSCCRQICQAPQTLTAPAPSRCASSRPRTGS